MSELIVFAFDSESGATQMAEEISRLQKQQLIQLEDAATVIRTPDGKAKIKQATHLVGVGAVGGAFWGTLIGLLFFAPWLGLAIGAVAGAITGALTDVGIDDDFIKEVRDTIEPGHSALFLLVRQWTPDKVLEELKEYQPRVLRADLSPEDEAKLRAAFGANED